MRDYVDLMSRLGQAANFATEHDRSLMLEAAEAIREMKVIADKMTSLGADLEEQVAEQLEADIFWDNSEEEQGYSTLREVVQRYPYGVVVHVGRAHTLPDIWAAWLPVSQEVFWSDSEEEVAARLDQEERLAESC